jgi:iron(III) transport system permease protein
VVAFGVFISLLPLLYVLLRTFQIGLGSLVEITFRPRMLELILNSLILTIAVCLTAGAIGTIQAWSTSRSNLKFRRVFQIVAVLPLAVPSYVLAYAWLAFSQDIDGFLGSWLVLSISTSPYVFLAVTAALTRHNSASEEVARTLGRSQIQVARSITWPAIKPAVLGSALLVALYTLSDFGAVSLMRFDTFTRAIYNAYRASFDRDAAAAIALILILLTVVLVIAQSRITQVKAVKESDQFRYSETKLNHWQFFVLGLLAFWFVVSIVIPVSSIIYWNLVGQSSAVTAEVVRALINTLSYGLFGGIAVSAIAIAIAILVVRYRNQYGIRAEQTILLTHALPGVVIALAFVFLVNQTLPALYQTSLLVIIAYVALFLPNAVSVIKVPISQVPVGIEEVSRTLGSTQMQTIRRVIIPAAGPGILSAVAFVALTVIKELPATLILRPTGIETLATRLWSATSINAFSAAAPYALLLIVVAGIPALLVNREVQSSRKRSNLGSDQDSLTGSKKLFKGVHSD